MRLIIAGSRNLSPTHADIDAALAVKGWRPTVVLCGMARGPDTAGAAWAETNGVPVKRFPAAWGDHGRAAGPLRNVAMANEADALLAFWDGASRGTAHMVQVMRDRGLPVALATPRWAAK